MVTGHEKELKLWRLPGLEQIEWNSSSNNASAGRNSSNLGSTTAMQIKVCLDQTANVIITSGTDKRVTMVEAASGRTICQAKSGEITTAMCLSNNFKHLITTSDHGVIYMWRLPIDLSKVLKSNADKQKKAKVPLTFIGETLE